MKHTHILLAILALSTNCSLLLAQVGINTENPQGIFHIDPVGDTNGNTNTEDDFIITNTGNVGIGTLNPDIKLTVKQNIAIGNLTYDTPLTGGGSKLEFLGKSNNTDPLYLYRYNRSETEGNLFLNIGDNIDRFPWSTVAPDYFVVGCTNKATGAFKQLFWVRSNGSVSLTGRSGRSIDLSKSLVVEEQPRLEVHGTMKIKGDVKVGQQPAMRSMQSSITNLRELKEYIEKNKHLPNIPSEESMQKYGVNLVNLHLQMQQMIDELSVYTKEQYDEIQKIDLLLDKQSKMIKF